MSLRRLFEHTRLVVLGTGTCTCTFMPSIGTCTGTCEKVHVAKTKSFSAVK